MTSSSDRLRSRIVYLVLIVLGVPSGVITMALPSPPDLSECKGVTAEVVEVDIRRGYRHRWHAHITVRMESGLEMKLRFDSRLVDVARNVRVGDVITARLWDAWDEHNTVVTLDREGVTLLEFDRFVAEVNRRNRGHFILGLLVLGIACVGILQLIGSYLNDGQESPDASEFDQRSATPTPKRLHDIT